MSFISMQTDTTLSELSEYLKIRRDDFIMTGSRDYELMQYTGLKDKNGKEIYEGDIVLRDREENRAKDLAYVDFKFGAFRLRRVYGSGMTYTFGSTRFTDKIEIIGNIYENPELLPVKE